MTSTMTRDGLIDTIMAGNPIRSAGGRRGRHAGGEWDWVDHVPARTLRRLTGAGYFTRNGLSIDEATDMIVQRVPGVDTADQAIEWYVRTALYELDLRQDDRAGVVRWEDQERPEEEWPADDDAAPDNTLPAHEPLELIELAPAECPTVESWDVEPMPVDPDARPTFYGSVRPVRRVSCWDSASDNTSRGLHRTWWWWRVRSWVGL